MVIGWRMQRCIGQTLSPVEWLEDLRDRTSKLRQSYINRGKRGADKRWGDSEPDAA
jgi:hypothetical protein